MLMEFATMGLFYRKTPPPHEDDRMIAHEMRESCVRDIIYGLENALLRRLKIKTSSGRLSHNKFQ